jgi:hypothetical protein
MTGEPSKMAEQPRHARGGLAALDYRRRSAAAKTGKDTRLCD